MTGETYNLDCNLRLLLYAGNKTFFHHSDRTMRIMADLIRQGRYADGIMGILALEEQEQLSLKLAQAEPGEPCPYGSGRKFKNCHGLSRRRRRSHT